MDSSRKPTLALHYEDDGLGLGKRLLFEASSLAAALDVTAGRQAQLFLDGTPVCRLLKADDTHPYWIVAACAPARENVPPLGASEDLPWPRQGFRLLSN